MSILKLFDLLRSAPAQLGTSPPEPEPEHYDPESDAMRSELDRLEAIKAEYVELLDAIQAELDMLYGNESIQAARRKTTLLQKRITVTEKVQKIDKKIETIYNDLFYY